MEENATNISIDQDVTNSMDRLVLTNGSSMNMVVQDGGLVAGLKRSALDRGEHNFSSHSTCSWLKDDCACAKILKTVDDCYEEDKMKLEYEECCPTSASEQLIRPLARNSTLTTFQNLSITYPYFQRTREDSTYALDEGDNACDESETQIPHSTKLAEMLEQAAAFAFTLEQMQNQSHQRHFTKSDATNNRNRRRAQRRNSFVIHRKNVGLLGGGASYPEFGMNRRSSFSTSSGNLGDNTSPEAMIHKNSASMSDIGYIHMTDGDEGNSSILTASALGSGCDYSSMDGRGSSSIHGPDALELLGRKEISGMQAFDATDDRSACDSNMDGKSLVLSTCQSSFGHSGVGGSPVFSKAAGKSKISRAA